MHRLRGRHPAPTRTEIIDTPANTAPEKAATEVTAGEITTTASYIRLTTGFGTETTHAENPTFAEQLNELFTRTTNTMVAKALTERGCPISVTYLSHLRNGTRTRPADHYVLAIAEYFDTPTAHFYHDPYPHDTDPHSEDLTIAHALHDPAVRRLLCNAHSLSPESIDLLLQFESHLRLLA